MKNGLESYLVCLIVAACLGGNLLAQEEPGGPGGPPPDELGDIGSGGPPIGQNGPGPNGGPPPNFDPAKFQQRFMEQVRQSLNVTNDQEWTVVQPLIQKVMEARREANMGGMRPGMGGLGGPDGRRPFGGQASAEQQELQKAVGEGVPTPQIKDALAKYRTLAKRSNPGSKLHRMISEQSSR